MTKIDHEDFNNSTKCWTCERTYEDVEVKVKDYDHVTGTYPGPKRNLTLIQVKIPCCVLWFAKLWFKSYIKKNWKI